MNRKNQDKPNQYPEYDQLNLPTIEKEILKCQDGSLVMAERRIFIVHYPHYAKAMALTGDYDLVCNGHEHCAVVERIRNIKGGDTLRIDPGTVAGVSEPATYVFGDLQTLEFEIRPVPTPMKN